MLKKLSILFVLVATASLPGCASVPMSSLKDDAARKDFPSPSPGTAGLYVYRNTTLGGALKKNLFIDGELVAETAPMTYFYFEVQEGKRKLSTESEFSPNDLIVDVEKGKNYFIRQSIKMGVFVYGAKLVLVPEEEGKKGVLQCKLAKNSSGTVIAVSKTGKSPELSGQSSLESEISPFDYYGQAEEELNTETYDKNLWAKALVEAEGDQIKRKAKYIVLRANQLYSEGIGSTSNLSANGKPEHPTNRTENYYAGVYSIEITGNLERFIRRGDSSLQLIQVGKKITGVFGKGGQIWGRVDDNEISFEWVIKNVSGKGKWNFSEDRKKITGVWTATWLGGGDWHLTKVE